MTALIIIMLICCVAFGVAKAIDEQKAPPNPNLVCPHCQTKGQVKVTKVVRKKGLSGGKATGALLTGGMSLLATGLSRKQSYSHMKCLTCKTEWDVA